MRSILTLLLALSTLVGCAGGAPPPDPAPSPSSSRHALLGETSPDAADARLMLQALIDATPSGGTLDLPPGDYVVTQAGSSDHALRVALPMTIRGYGVTIRQAADAAPSVRLIRVDAPDVTLVALTLDGQSELQKPDEHRAGVFVAAPRARLIGVVARHFTGDGVYLYGSCVTRVPTCVVGADASGAILEDLTLEDNDRNGLTMSGPIHDLAVRGGSFSRNAAQQIDSEPGAPDVITDVVITGARLDPGGASGGYALTVSGTGTAWRSARWRVVGNTITDGGIFVVWADDVTVVGNTIASASAKPCVYGYRTINRLVVAHNACTMTSVDAVFPSGVATIATSATSAADGVMVVDNVITMASPTGMGIRAQGTLGVTMVGNVLRGSGVVNTGGTGIQVRPTALDFTTREAVVVGNSVTGFGKRGLSVVGNVSARLAQLTAVGNSWGDGGSVQDVGLYLDDGSHPLVHGTLVEQRYGSGVLTGRLGEGMATYP